MTNDRSSAADSVELLWMHILVRKDRLPGTVGQIVLPEARAQRPVSGVVLKAGPTLEADYPVGARVLFAEYAGHTFNIDNDTVTILSKSEILGIIPPEANVGAES